MDKDRAKICKIVSEMLDNQDKSGIFPTSTAYRKLEHLVESARIEAIGWTHAFCCSSLDRENDPRLINVPDMLGQANKDLSV